VEGCTEHEGGERVSSIFLPCEGWGILGRTKGRTNRSHVSGRITVGAFACLQMAEDTEGVSQRWLEKPGHSRRAKATGRPQTSRHSRNRGNRSPTEASTTAPETKTTRTTTTRARNDGSGHGLLLTLRVETIIAIAWSKRTNGRWRLCIGPKGPQHPQAEWIVRCVGSGCTAQRREVRTWG